MPAANNGYCAAASPTPKAPADALQFATAGDGKNLTVDVAGNSEALTGQVPPAFRDLIMLASYDLDPKRLRAGGPFRYH